MALPQGTPLKALWSDDQSKAKPSSPSFKGNFDEVAMNLYPIKNKTYVNKSITKRNAHTINKKCQ